MKKNEGIHVRKYSRNKCGLSSNRRVWLCSVCAPFCLAGALQVSNVVVLEKRTAAESVFGLLQYEVRGRRRLQASSPNAGVDRGQVSTCSNGLLIEGWPLAACSAAEKGPRPAEPSRAEPSWGARHAQAQVAGLVPGCDEMGDVPTRCQRRPPRRPCRQPGKRGARIPPENRRQSQARHTQKAWGG